MQDYCKDIHMRRLYLAPETLTPPVFCRTVQYQVVSLVRALGLVSDQSNCDGKIALDSLIGALRNMAGRGRAARNETPKHHTLFW